MRKTRLEYVKGNSAKFWEITVTDTIQLIRYGRIGTEGIEKKKSFDSQAEAIKEAQLLVRQKLKKGYEATRTPTRKRAIPKPSNVKSSFTSSSVASSIARIKKWMEQNHPSLAETFNPPAKKSDIVRAEKRLKLDFPQDVKDYFLTTNGIRMKDGIYVDLFLGCGMPLKIEELPKHWNRNLELGDPQDDWEWNPKGAIQEVAFHKNWIPLSADHVAIAVDLEPGPIGTAGQVITFATRWNFRFRYVIANSLAQYFELVAANLEAGKLTFFDEDDLDLSEIFSMSLKKNEFLPLDCSEGLKQFHAIQRKARKKK